MERVQRIVLGISSGIAAYKMPQLIRLFQKQNVDITTVLTPHATDLVGIEALRVISKHPVYSEDRPASHDMAHIELAKWGQYLLICPATANTIAKIAHGIADNLLTTLALSFEKRLIIAPAMNVRMWHNAATQENLSLLSTRGAIILPVGSGELACGDDGPGRLLELETIVDRVCSVNMPQFLQGKKVLIASGPTVEPIDSVRVLTNRSSGQMGKSLAHAALMAGADVCVVSGPVRHAPEPGCTVIPVLTALEMKAALEKEFDNCDICIMAAAVSDFRPHEVLQGKKHRDESSTWNISCVANPDIAQSLGHKKTHQFLVGFSLEASMADDRPLQKMKSKKCDMMVVNTIDQSLETKTTSIRLLYNNDQEESVIHVSKNEAASIILNRIGLRTGLLHG